MKRAERAGKTSRETRGEIAKLWLLLFEILNSFFSSLPARETFA
jgi:hypothetical protein